LEDFSMEATAIAYLAAGFGAGLVVLGASFGIGKLAAAAMEASGRQPEVAAQVRVSMLIAAALIEGATFFALAICILLALK
jgi:F-type H+-transporting ATPase subunit c